MKLPRRNFLQLAAGLAAVPAIRRFAWAQTYPTRPVRIIVATGPGGAPDILARLIGQWLFERLGQQFVIENRPGGGNNIGTEAVVRAARTVTRSSWSTRRRRSTRRSMKNSTTILSAISRRSRVSSGCRSSWWSLHRFRPRRFQSSSLLPKPIPAKSTWLRPASRPRATSPVSCSR